MEIANKRIKWIDYLKGFLFVMVIIIHTDKAPDILYKLCGFFTASRMPCYFLISGFLWSNRKYPTFFSYFKHKTKVLLLPYFSLSLLILLLSPPLYQGGGVNYLIEQITSIFISGQSCQYANPLWFVFVLYMLSIIFFFVPKKVYGIVIISLLTAILTILLPNQYFAIGTVCACLPFFSLGFLLKMNTQLIHKLQFKKSTCFIILSIILYLIDRYVLHHDIALRYNMLGNIFLFYGAAITGCFGLIGFFQNFQWNKIPILSNGLAFISRNSLIILGTQYFILQVILQYNYFSWLHNQILIFALRFFILIGIEMILIYLFRIHFSAVLGKEKISRKDLFRK